eukprot:TRINITY_DN1693_c0_g1_i1.p1 TRINITY_DN1693_c0_g1~~TRINITY_DN1693_c0_g1_i1.p1  ORF type:complete len:110 (+),score=12.24 TRINITY_DN1693_c0_g1_i1:500-829(+)
MSPTDLLAYFHDQFNTNVQGDLSSIITKKLNVVLVMTNWFSMFYEDFVIIEQKANNMNIPAKPKIQFLFNILESVPNSDDPMVSIEAKSKFKKKKKKTTIYQYSITYQF